MLSFFLSLYFLDPTLFPTNRPTSSQIPTFVPSDLPSVSSKPTLSPSQLVEQPTFSFSITGKLVLMTVLDVCSLSQGAIAELLENIIDTIKSISCLGDTESCTVIINEYSDCQSSNESSQLRRSLASRHLQQTQFELEYEITIEQICSNGCSDDEVQSVANELYSQVTDELKEAIDDGSMIQDIQTMSSSEVANLLATAIITGDFSDLVLPLLSLLADYYPDWEGRSGKCLNDDKAPRYMKKNGDYFESSLQACCVRWYSWDFGRCMGDSNHVQGFYPNWDSSVVKCLNATTVLPPQYMQSNPSHWLYDSAQDCCSRYYSWANNECINNSDQTDAFAVGSRKWYVDWVLEKVRFFYFNF